MYIRQGGHHILVCFSVCVFSVLVLQGGPSLGKRDTLEKTGAGTTCQLPDTLPITKSNASKH